MNFQSALFYFFAAILLFAGLRVITARNPVHAALYLVLAFFSAAGLWMLLEAEFLAIVLVLVYVGAVMVLFLFVVMMLDINPDQLRQNFWRYLPVALPVALLIGVEMVLILGSRYFAAAPPPTPLPAGYSNTKALGEVLYTQYVYAFEVAAVILLVAIVAAIALTMRRRKDSKYVDPARQVRVRKEDRLHVLKMKVSRYGDELHDHAHDGSPPGGDAASSSQER